MNGEGGKPDGFRNDNTQTFVKTMCSHRQKMTEELFEKSNALQAAVKELSRLTDFETNFTHLVLDILADLSKVVDVTDEIDLAIYLDEISRDDIHVQVTQVVQSIYKKIKCRIEKNMQKCAELEVKLVDTEMRCQNELKFSMMNKDSEIRALENIVRHADTSNALLKNEMLEAEAKMKKNFNRVMDQKKIIYDQEIEKLTAEVAKKQNTIDELREMQVKRANISQLREQKAQTKKELEDMEDALSKEIKTLQMRKIFVHNMQNRIKGPNDAEVNDTHQKIVEQGYSNTMAGITALRNDIGKLQDSLRRSNSGR